jgi:hypothetical protein
LEDKDFGGRPRIEFTEKEWEQIDAMCGILCRKEEICAIVNCSEDTLERRIKERSGLGFAEYFTQKSSNGKMSLRRRQYNKAMDGDNTMLVWLGKNWLKQTDAVEMNHTGEAKVFVLAYPVDGKAAPNKLENDSEE